MSYPVPPAQPDGGRGSGIGQQAAAAPPALSARALTAPESVDMATAVALPSAAMGGYAGLRVAAERVPNFKSALEAARSESFRGLLPPSTAPTNAARTAANRGALAATRSVGERLAAAAPAVLSKKTAMMGLSRVALAPIPVVGPIILGATWLFDKDTRSLVNGLISCVGGVGFPPDGDAPPSPPRTHFLPLTSDGNRDPDIEKIDQGMTGTGAAALNYSPDDVWPSQPAITTTPDFKGTVEAFNRIGPKAKGIADSIRSVANSVTGSSAGEFTQALPAKLGPIADALDEYGTGVAGKAVASLNGVTEKANDFYQNFRSINNQNRAEIANSTSGLIPFTANTVNTGAMDDSVAAAKQSAEEIGKHNAEVSSSFANWSVPAAALPQAPVTPTAKSNAVAPPPPAAAPAAAPWTGSAPSEAPAATTEQKSPLDSLLSGLPSSIPPMQMPSMPGMGGMPMPSMPQMGPAGPESGLMDPMMAEKPVDDLEGAEEKPEDAEAPVKPEDEAAEDKPEPDDVAPVAAGPVGAPAATPPPPGADRTVRIGNKDYLFDSPRVAAAVRETMEAAASGPGLPIPQVLTDNGYTVPPVGQALGERADSIGVAEPGAVIVSNNGADHAWYLGNGEALTEQGEVKPVDQVLNPVGANDGIFAVPEPGTPVVDPTAAPVAEGSVSTSPPTVSTTDVPRPEDNPAQPGATPSPFGQPSP